MEACNLCGGKVAYVHHGVVYGRTFSDWPYIYMCEKCGAFVGVHHGTNKPLGTLADSTTRSARASAHAAFDTLWGEGSMSRSEAYRWLAKQLGLTEDECHIGMFTKEQCQKTIELAMKAKV